MKAIAIFVLAGAVWVGIHQQVNAWPTIRSSETKTYDLRSDGSVAVDDSSGDVKVTGWNSDRVELTVIKTAWSSEDLHRLDTRVDSRSDRFAIAARYPSRCMNCDVSLQLKVPARAHVTIETSSGDVSVKSIAGPARVDSGSGDVSIKDVGGEVHVHASSGDVTLDAIGSPIEAYTSSGDINAHRLVADANLAASSGALNADYEHFAGVRLIRMESSSGDVSLTVPRGVGFMLEATTNSGTIDSNLHLPVSERDAGAQVAAQVGSGKTSVQLHATSGDIAITMR
jgi:DUF4097 and DUF4098 domain-containing protein YvlB